LNGVKRDQSFCQESDSSSVSTKPRNIKTRWLCWFDKLDGKKFLIDWIAWRAIPQFRCQLISEVFQDWPVKWWLLYS